MSEGLMTLLLDTNILLLFLVVRVDAGLLSTFKRVSNFDESDVALLVEVVKRYSQIITTPHILAEVSNFVDQAPIHRRRELVGAFRRFAEDQQEHYEQAMELVRRPEFESLGLADTGIYSLSASVTVLTADGRLYSRIIAAGKLAINFNHLRGKTILNGHLLA